MSNGQILVVCVGINLAAFLLGAWLIERTHRNIHRQWERQ